MAPTPSPGRHKNRGYRKKPASGRPGARRNTKRPAAILAAAAVLVLAALGGALWLVGGNLPESAPVSPGQSAEGRSPRPELTPEPESPKSVEPSRTLQPYPETPLPRPSVPSDLTGRTEGPLRPAGVPERPRPRKGRIVIVIDDVGYNLKELEPFLRFPGPLTFAVLPGLPHSKDAARMIKAAGKELILHQPMEAVGGEDPGPNALRLGMDELTIAAMVAQNLTTVPGAVGMNNHMGSAVSKDPDMVRAVLESARAAGLYYLDSLTIEDSMVHSSALSLNLKTWERDVFLDNYPERAAILKQFDDGVKHAEKKGLSVMIGHVWSAQLAQTLVDLYPGLIEQGFSLTTISRIMLEDSDEDIGD